MLKQRGGLDDGWEVSDVQDHPTEGGAIQVRLARVEYKVVGLMIDEGGFPGMTKPTSPVQWS